jgi:hypothetical protein
VFPAQSSNCLEAGYWAKAEAAQFGGNATKLRSAYFSIAGAHFYAEIRLILRREKPIVFIK